MTHSKLENMSPSCSESDSNAIAISTDTQVWTKGIIDFRSKKPFIPWVKGKIKAIKSSQCLSTCPNSPNQECPWVLVHYLQPVVDRTFRLLDPQYRQAYACEAKRTGGFISGQKHIKACELWSGIPTHAEPIAEFPAQLQQPIKPPQHDGFPAELKLLKAEEMIRSLVQQTITETKLGNSEKAISLEDECEELIEASENFATSNCIRIDGSEERWILIPWEVESSFCNLPPFNIGDVCQTKQDRRQVQITAFKLRYSPNQDRSKVFQIEIVGAYRNSQIHFTLEDLEVPISNTFDFHKTMPQTPREIVTSEKEYIQLSLFTQNCIAKST